MAKPNKLFDRLEKLQGELHSLTVEQTGEAESDTSITITTDKLGTTYSVVTNDGRGNSESFSRRTMKERPGPPPPPNP